ncbi:MAG: hypothetical protein CL910_19200 [Deltaproteobacteria bacterium]|jgi:hypothetical protein|nr:hypothetical protein [Deltaproteobacteria bacterium]
MPWRLPALPTALLLSVALVAGACGSEPDTPEARIRRALGALEAAAEAGDVAAFKQQVSERYSDEHGHDKQTLGTYVSFHVLRNSNRHVVLRVRDVLMVDPGRAEVVVIAGIAGSRPVAGELAAFRGNVYQVDADLEEEDGQWRLVWAQWKPTPASDLL